MDLLETLNELKDHLDGLYWSVDGFYSHPDLSKHNKQDTDMKMLPVEYVLQRGDADYGYSGNIYFQTEYSDGDGGKQYLKITYND